MKVRTLHQCSVCGKCLSTNRSLNEHMNIHQQRKPFSCQFCDFTAAQKMTIKRHTDRQHSPVSEWGYPCPHCDRTFPEPAAYKTHTTSSHFGYSCTFGCICCGCSYRTRSFKAIREHSTKHPSYLSQILPKLNKFVKSEDKKLKNVCEMIESCSEYGNRYSKQIGPFCMLLVEDEYGAGYNSERVVLPQFQKDAMQKCEEKFGAVINASELNRSRFVPPPPPKTIETIRNSRHKPGPRQIIQKHYYNFSQIVNAKLPLIDSFPKSKPKKSVLPKTPKQKTEIRKVVKPPAARKYRVVAKIQMGDSNLNNNRTWINQSIDDQKINCKAVNVKRTDELDYIDIENEEDECNIIDEAMALSIGQSALSIDQSVISISEDQSNVLIDNNQSIIVTSDDVIGSEVVVDTVLDRLPDGQIELDLD